MRSWSHRRDPGPAGPPRVAAGLLAAALAVSSPAHAAAVRIANLSDLGGTNLDPTMTKTFSSNVCVYSTSGRYSITATGSGSGGAFALSGGAGLNLPYGVQWNDVSGASTGTALSAGTALSSQTTSLLAICVLGASSATLIVTLAPSDMETATAGLTYSGVLTLLVAAQ